MSNRKDRGRITTHEQEDEGHAKFKVFAARIRTSRKHKSREQDDRQRAERELAEKAAEDIAAEKQEREAAAATAVAERAAIAAAAAVEKQEREAAEAIAAAERAAIAAAAVVEKQAREAAEAIAAADRVQAEDDRDHIFNATLTIETSENVRLGIGALNLEPDRDPGDPYYIDDNYDPANDTFPYVDNIAIGSYALQKHTKPINLLAIGYASQAESIYDAVHDSPVADVGNKSVSVGSMTLMDGTTQYENTAVGFATLRSITTGYDNVGIGNNALTFSTVASKSVAVGSYANALNTTGQYNVSVGYYSLFNCTNSGNVAVGYTSGQYLENSSYNTLIGYSVAQNLVSGTNNIVIGNQAEASTTTINNEITLGDTNISAIRCNQQSFSSLSDVRDKADIADIPEDAGLQFIDKLRPVTFYWDRREWYLDNTSDGSKMNKVHSEETPNSGQRMGFIAQEVLEVVNDYKYIKESGMVSESNPEKLEFALGNLVTPLVKAVQQLSEQNKDLLDRINILEQK